MERVFPLYSPLTASIEIKRRGDVRKAKLYHLRNLRGKAARIKEKLVNTLQASISTKEDASNNDPIE